MMEMNKFNAEGKINYNPNLFPEEPSLETVYASSLFFTKKIKRLILCGKGGSGKDHLRQILEQGGFKYCVSHTTRPRRTNEEQGKDYFFVENLKDFEILKGMFERKEFYEVNLFAGWIYGTSIQEFNSSNLMILTPSGISNLKPEDREESFVLFLDIDQKVRKTRLSARKDVDSVERRLKTDEEDFANFSNFDFKICDPNFQVGSEIWFDLSYYQHD